MKLVVDTFCWIDYLEGNEAGEKVKNYVEDPDNEIIITNLNIAEISSIMRRKNFDVDKALDMIFSISKIYNFNAEFSKEAGLLHADMRKTIKDFGLIDAFILLVARKLKAKIITGDEHFRKMKGAILIK
jgi:predicted nucleic acid-binding protein